MFVGSNWATRLSSFDGLLKPAFVKIENYLICGIRPALLNNVFKPETFDTLRLMRIGGLGEPAASHKLRRLAEEGWVSFGENHDGVDWWTTAAKAHRLGATRLIKRFPVKVGREVVEDVVAEARDRKSVGWGRSGEVR